LCGSLWRGDPHKSFFTLKIDGFASSFLRPSPSPAAFLPHPICPNISRSNRVGILI
jgi:hypothetical protein